MSPPTPGEAWLLALADLKQQMTQATYNTWLNGAQLLECKDSHYTIQVASERAVEWLSKQLHETITRTLSGAAGRVVTVSFVTQPTLPLTLPTVNSAASKPPLFPGFEPYYSNFTQFPKQFCEIVVKEGPPVVTAFVAAVIDNTIGIIVNYHTGQRREYWEASYTEIGLATGISSRVSVRKAVRLSRERGYVVQRAGQVNSKYRLRREGEPVDAPGDSPQGRIII